jgi:long-chain acyl-CoA synthetase
VNTASFWHFAQQSANHLALAAPDGRHWSRRELGQESDRLAQALQSKSMGQGNTVTALLPDGARSIALHLACDQLGSRFIALDHRCSLPEVVRHLRSVEPGLLVYDSQTGPAWLEIISLAYSMAYDDLLGPQTGAEGPDPGRHFAQDPAAPPGDAGVQASADAERLMKQFGIPGGEDNVHYCGLPIACEEAGRWVMASLHLGHPVVLAARWNPLQMLRAVQQYRVTTCFLAPSQLGELLSLPKEVREDYEITSMRALICSGPTCPAEFHLSLRDWWGDALQINQCAQTIHATQQSLQG